MPQIKRKWQGVANWNPLEANRVKSKTMLLIKGKLQGGAGISPNLMGLIYYRGGVKHSPHQIGLRKDYVGLISIGAIEQ